MSQSLLRLLIPLLWLGWLLYWWVSAARGTKTTIWRESIPSALSYRIPLLLGVLLLLAPRAVPSVLSARFVPPGEVYPWLGVVLLAGGLGFAVFARRHLGRNWSANVTVKEGHTLIRTGPYRYVRHPIYTGILFGLLGTAIAIGEWRGLLALCVVALSFVIKSRLEEERMIATFPEYNQYRQETAALVPFIF